MERSTRERRPKFRRHPAPPRGENPLISPIWMRSRRAWPAGLLSASGVRRDRRRFPVGESPTRRQLLTCPCQPYRSCRESRKLPPFEFVAQINCRRCYEPLLLQGNTVTELRPDGGQLHWPRTPGSLDTAMGADVRHKHRREPGMEVENRDRGGAPVRCISNSSCRRRTVTSFSPFKVRRLRGKLALAAPCGCFRSARSLNRT
jgi:hypothetical protein